MSLLCTLGLLAQLAAPARIQPPVLAFPEPGVDDSAAYQGYQTRFHRDVAGTTVQVYVDRREARVVHVLGNAENESVGFTARGPAGEAAALRWASEGAITSADGRRRVVEYALAAEAPSVRLGWFLLGSMRVERDFQAWRRHRAPFSAPPFRLEETQRLIAALRRLPVAERQRHLALLGANDVATLRDRLRPSVTTSSADGHFIARLVQPSIDGRDTLLLEILADRRRVRATMDAGVVTLRRRAGGTLPFTIRIATTARALTPLTREQIFAPAFLAFLDSARVAGQAPALAAASLRARWLERQVRGMELLASREKLMAGLPTYGTYFGRDMQMTALMMRPIWRPEMAEAVIGSVLQRLSSTGQVSHEEALGGQAVREGAAEYATLLDARRAATTRAAADSLLAQARDVLRRLRQPRENYNMLDDEYQLVVLVGRWLADSSLALARKAAFLQDSAGGDRSRLASLLRVLSLVARGAAPYAADPVPANLVSFPARAGGGWSSASWRDSNAGYAGGRFAMDINALWVPHALLSLRDIVAALRQMGVDADSVTRLLPDEPVDAPLLRLVREDDALRSAIEVWQGAPRHFVVRLSADEVRLRLAARLAAMPEEERRHWSGLLAASRADRDSLVFSAIALDSAGKPIAVAHSDAATRLFLEGGDRAAAVRGTAWRDEVLREVRLFARPYPAGLLVNGVGPVVANDAFATPAVWRTFKDDPYHGPRVVWGREVNLFLLGVAGALADSGDASGRAPAAGAAETAVVVEWRRQLRDAMQRVLRAVEASGFRSELWSYQFRDGVPVPVRYGSAGDLQLWSVTDLVVQFMLTRMEQ